MSTSRPSAPAVLFRAPARPWAFALALVLAVVLLIPLAVLLGVLGTASGSGTGTVLGIGAGLVVLLVGGLMVVSARQRFTVTAAGIEVVSYLSTRRLRWSDIRLIRVGPASPLSPRATKIVLSDGSSVRPFATSMNYALWRGETPYAHGVDGTAPTRCTLAAIDAHRRYLAGEFGR